MKVVHSNECTAQYQSEVSAKKDTSIKEMSDTFYTISLGPDLNEVIDSALV